MLRLSTQQQSRSSRASRSTARVLVGLLLLGGAGCPHRPAPRAARSASVPSAPPPAVESLASTRAYIRSGWRSLARTHRGLLAAARDPKASPTMGRWPVYVARDERLPEIEGALARVLPAAEFAQLRLLHLPAAGLPSEHGLLYLPRPYVVPGGRFNEMYGWDSYFIVLGLLRDGELELARDMTDNALYEVAHYGSVLNANRTYYLTRSQPPLLSRMVLAVFERTKDRVWLASAWPLLERFHATWLAPPHSFDGLGLARYHDRGEGPAPEVIASERDAHGRTHYDRVRDQLRAQPQPAGFPVERYYDRAADRLTPLFYSGDRAMRESGFDPTNRFGPFGAETTQIAPVCLNVLLQRMEQDMATIARLLDRRTAEVEWRRRAEERRVLIDRYLWDEQAGVYLDYDTSTGRRRPYLFATTFYPLWAGIASPQQAVRVRGALQRLERPGGVMTSAYTTGNQWDAPFGWAPLQLFAVEGLRRAGYEDDARRIARAFTSMVAADFARRGAIVEKYDVVRRSSEVEAQIQFGYAENQVGFGWTNGVFLELLAVLEAKGATQTATAPAAAATAAAFTGRGLPRPGEPSARKLRPFVAVVPSCSNFSCDDVLGTDRGAKLGKVSRNDRRQEPTANVSRARKRTAPLQCLQPGPLDDRLFMPLSAVCAFVFIDDPSGTGDCT